MKLRSAIKAFAIGGVLLGASAHAATLTVSDAFGPEDIEISGTLSVDKFDSSLGTLTGVSFTITGAITSLISVTNDGTGTVTGNAFTSVDYDLASALLPLGGSPDFTVTVNTGSITLGAGEGALFPLTGSDSISGSLAASADFIGPGTIDVDFETLTSFGAALGSDATVSTSTDAAILLSVTYDFEDNIPPVPVPAAGLLMASLIGLGCLTAVSPRRRKS